MLVRGVGTVLLIRLNLTSKAAVGKQTKSHRGEIWMEMLRKDVLKINM